MIFGIITGLLAAFCQSLVYLATRHYVQRRPAGASRELLVLAHVWMGLFSVVALPFVWPHEAWGVLREVAWPLIATCVFYLLGQICLLLALKHAEPSRVSPLLGIKIVVLAVMASFVELPHRAGEAAAPIGLTWLQWVAVMLCVVAAVALNFSGARLRRRAIVAIALACLWYSLSDWNITLLVKKVTAHVTAGQAPVLAAALCYGVCGVAAVCFLPALGTRDLKAWRDSIPFAALWFAAMLFLFACFGVLDPVLGNILQSSRGLMSILLGSLLVYRGHFHIEPLGAKGVFGRRLGAGVLMFLAVSLYVIRDPEVLTMKKAGGGVQGAPHGTRQQSGQQPGR